MIAGNISMRILFRIECTELLNFWFANFLVFINSVDSDVDVDVTTI